MATPLSSEWRILSFRRSNLEKRGLTRTRVSLDRSDLEQQQVVPLQELYRMDLRRIQGSRQLTIRFTRVGLSRTEELVYHSLRLVQQQQQHLEWRLQQV